MSWISTESQSPWVLLGEYSDKQERGPYVGTVNGQPHFYLGGRRVVTTKTEEKRGLTETAATLLRASIMGATQQAGTVVTASVNRANEAGGYSVVRITTTYGDWEGYN